MEGLPLYGKVECTDGPFGESVTVVINPVAQAVTHIVVREKSLTGDRMVPLSKIAAVRDGVIVLKCSKQEVTGMDPFLQTQYVESTVPSMVTFQQNAYVGGQLGNPVYVQPYAAPMTTDVVAKQVETLAEGESSVHRGTKVEATDGAVGTVSELVIDPATGKITHMILQEGHRIGGKQEIMLPLASISRREGDTVFVNLSKKDIAAIPAIPVQRAGAMTEGMRIEMIGIIYDTMEAAGKRLEEFQTMHRAGTFRIINAALLVKDKSGKMTFKETGDWTGKKGAKVGALLGGAIGLLGGPAGVFAGAAIGAALVGGGAKLKDSGFKDDSLRNLDQYLQPGTSALLMVVQHQFRAKLEQQLRGEKGVVFQGALSDKLVADLLAQPK
jgi:uncharacterized membrane protein/sporulation protein YlmC with PRC-barrel domain